MPSVPQQRLAYLLGGRGSRALFRKKEERKRSSRSRLKKEGTSVKRKAARVFFLNLQLSLVFDFFLSLS